MSSPKRMDSTSFILLILIAVPSILIWQRDNFPTIWVVLGTLICGVLLFLHLRRLSKKDNSCLRTRSTNAQQKKYCCKWGWTLKLRLFASLYFCSGRRISIWLFVVNFNYIFSIGQRFRSGRYKISHLAAIPVRCTSTYATLPNIHIDYLFRRFLRTRLLLILPLNQQSKYY